MEPGQELFLELVSIPFQLGTPGVRVVVLENELAGDQAQLQRITRCWRRSDRRFARRSDRLPKGHIKKLVEVDAFQRAGWINLGIINQIRGVKRIGLFT